mmetsp:Transcript_84469/g.126654  ORF Transcript_84469/g.126654 Transcript_84469/m.126654 type:complete len:203 (+) Transcript_84469:417-1025(+)
MHNNIVIRTSTKTNRTNGRNWSSSCELVDNLSLFLLSHDKIQGLISDNKISSFRFTPAIKFNDLISKQHVFTLSNLFLEWVIIFIANIISIKLSRNRILLSFFLPTKFISSKSTLFQSMFSCLPFFPSTLNSNDTIKIMSFKKFFQMEKGFRMTNENFSFTELPLTLFKLKILKQSGTTINSRTSPFTSHSPCFTGQFFVTF